MWARPSKSSPCKCATNEIKDIRYHMIHLLLASVFTYHHDDTDAVHVETSVGFETAHISFYITAASFLGPRKRYTHPPDNKNQRYCVRQQYS